MEGRECGRGAEQEGSVACLNGAYRWILNQSTSSALVMMI